MGSKAIAFLGFFLTMFLLITSQVAAARQLSQVSSAEAAGRQLIDISKTVHTSMKATVTTDQYGGDPTIPPRYTEPPCGPYGC